MRISSGGKLLKAIGMALVVMAPLAGRAAPVDGDATIHTLLEQAHRRGFVDDVEPATFLSRLFAVMPGTWSISAAPSTISVEGDQRLFETACRERAVEISAADPKLPLFVATDAKDPASKTQIFYAGANVLSFVGNDRRFIETNDDLFKLDLTKDTSAVALGKYRGLVGDLDKRQTARFLSDNVVLLEPVAGGNSYLILARCSGRKGAALKPSEVVPDMFRAIILSNTLKDVQHQSALNSSGKVPVFETLQGEWTPVDSYSSADDKTTLANQCDRRMIRVSADHPPFPIVTAKALPAVDGSTRVPPVDLDEFELRFIANQKIFKVPVRDPVARLDANPQAWMTMVPEQPSVGEAQYSAPDYSTEIGRTGKFVRLAAVDDNTVIERDVNIDANGVSLGRATFYFRCPPRQ